MVIHLRVDFEIADNRANNLVVGAVSAVENLKFPLEDGEQLLNIAMLSGQALNDHGRAPQLDRSEQKILISRWPQLLRWIKPGPNNPTKIVSMLHHKGLLAPRTDSVSGANK